jgi:hypothetical protein
MAGQTEQAAGTDISPIGVVICQASDRHLLGAGVRDDHGLGLCSQRADRAGTSPGGATPHGVLENVLGSAVPTFIVTALVSGNAGARDIAGRSFWWWVSLRWYLISPVHC